MRENLSDPSSYGATQCGNLPSTFPNLFPRAVRLLLRHVLFALLKASIPDLRLFLQVSEVKYVLYTVTYWLVVRGAFETVDELRRVNFGA